MKPFTSMIPVLLTLLFLTGSPLLAQTKKVKQARIEKQIARIDQDAQELRLRINRLTYEKYFDLWQQTDEALKLSELKSFSLSRLLDTVPQLAEAKQRYRDVYKEWQNVISTDPEYDSIHKDWMRLRNSGDKEAVARTRKRYEEMYSRLRKTNPEYPAMNNKRIRAFQQQNLEVARYLLEYYHQKGEVMPTRIIPNNILQDIRNMQPIRNLENELNVLQQVRRKLMGELISLRYGTKNTNQRPISIY